MPALDQHVGADHHPAVGSGDHGGVVTGAEGDTGRLYPARGDATDDAEFTGVMQAAIVAARHA